MIQQKHTNSSVTLLFGDPVDPKSPFNIQADFFLYSSKIKNMKFNIAEYLNIDLVDNSFLIEMSTDEDGEDVAAEINKIIESSSIDQNLASKDISLKCVGKGQKVFLIVSGDRFTQAMNSLGSSLNEKSSPSEEIKLLSVNVRSMQNLTHLKSTAENVDIWVALLESLEAKLTFVKSDLTTNLIQTLLSQSPNLEKASNMFKMFDYFDLRLKCESASILPNFERAFEPKKVPLKSNFESLQKKLNKNIKGYLLGDKLSMSMVGEIDNLSILLDILFS